MATEIIVVMMQNVERIAIHKSLNPVAVHSLFAKGWQSGLVRNEVGAAKLVDLITPLSAWVKA